MPIEIRELIIEGSLNRQEDQGEESTQLLTQDDLEQLREELTNAGVSDGTGLTSSQKRQLMDEILQEVRKLIEDKWRR